MAFIEKTDPVVLNIKLTTKGRELLSTGNLNFKYFAIGDSEIDYGFTKAVHTADANFTAFNSNVLRPADNNPNVISFIPRNYSGDPYNVISSIPTTWYPVTNTPDPIGFFTNVINNSVTFINDSNHVKQPDAMVYMSGITGGYTLKLRKTPTYGTSGEEPQIGDFVLVKWTLNGDTTSYLLDKTKPTPYLMYKIMNILSGTLAADNIQVVVDRKLPNFSGHNPTGKTGVMIYYNQLNYSGNTTILNELSTDYLDESVTSFLENSQCPTIIFPFWNMSIIFTEEIAGVKSGTTNAKYTQFKTRGFGGFVSYIQSQVSYYKKLGVIHYSNQSPANVYGEGFYQNTPKLEIPTIMWHKSSGKTMGLTLKAGSGYTLVNLGIHYYDLIDAKNSDYVVVGKIFDELKMFLIEDQELLYAMSYKSNRNWTLPWYDLTTGGNIVAPPAPPQTLFVQTFIGTPGSIKGTGGYNIAGYQNITEYGVEYKVVGTSTWKRIKVGEKLLTDSFKYDITGTTPSTTYNYRAYVKIGNNEYIDHSNDNVQITTPVYIPPVIPPSKPIPQVYTVDGVAGIGKIENTGGYQITGNTGISVEKYGMEYRIQGNATWIPTTQLNGPILGTTFQYNITGLVNTNPTIYEYRAYIQVAGVRYPPINSTSFYKTITVLAQPVVTTYAPQVISGSIVMQKAQLDETVNVLLKNNSVTDRGGLPLTRYGVLYTQSSTFNTPDKLIYGNVGADVKMVYQDGDLPTTVSVFTTSLVGLADSSYFWYRAFAMNSVGIGYGGIEAATTIAAEVVTPSETVYITNVTQTGTAPTQVLAGKIGVSKPLTAGQKIILHVRTNAVSDTLTTPNKPVLVGIRACAYYTVGTNSTNMALAGSFADAPPDPPVTSSNENFGTIEIDSTSIGTTCLHAEAWSASKNGTTTYTNTASFTIQSIDNVGGANYTLSTNKITASSVGGTYVPPKIIGGGALPAL